MNPAAPVTSARGISVPIPTVAQGSPGSFAHSASGALPRCALGSPRSSVGMLLAEAAEDREDQDLQVQAQRPVLDVVEVVLDALLDRGVAPPAVHLGPARHPALH